MMEPREAVQPPAVSGRCPNLTTQQPTTEETERFFTEGVDARGGDSAPEQELADRQADETKRAGLLTSLVFAARNLAQRSIQMRHTLYGSSRYCAECQAEVEPDPLRHAHEHHTNCNTGLVLVILSELARLPRPVAPARCPGTSCPACGLEDGAWVSERIALAQSPAALEENQRIHIAEDGVVVYTHLCPEKLAQMGGAA